MATENLTVQIQEFRSFLSSAKRRIDPLRKSKPGVSLCFDTDEARKAHESVRNATRMLKNDRDDAPAGKTFLTAEKLAGIKARIEASLERAGV